MTNKEVTNSQKAREIFSDNKHECETHGYAQDTNEILFMIEKMGLWKDRQFAKEKQALIDKACEWLKDNADDFIEFGNYTDDSSGVLFHIDSLIDNFRKAMEKETEK